MSKSYTPGLKVLKNTIILKERILPIKGEVHSTISEKVKAETVVASTEIPGNVQMINVANELNIDANQVPNSMLIKIDEEVKKGQIIARNLGFFGFFKSEIKSPIDGKLINVSEVTGQVIISEKPLSIEVDAYIPGKVEKVYDKEGVLIKSLGTFVQGIIGISGENKGILKVLVDSPSKQIKVSDLDDSLKNKIVVCGSYIDYDIYNHASKIGIKGIVCGGFDYENITKILGSPLGVAITGTEKVMNLILTEGFGPIDMSKKTFDLLKENDDKYVSINGATQIRAGVLRPEIFIESLEKTNSKEFNEDDLIISEGSIVRVIREPYFGKLGKVVSLPSELMKMKSETMVRVAEIEFEDKSKEIIPRANLEVILSN